VQPAGLWSFGTCIRAQVWQPVRLASGQMVAGRWFEWNHFSQRHYPRITAAGRLA
jgi:hypothetical protein